MQAKNQEMYKKLGLNITYYRRDRKLSQIQLAELVDISRTHISRIENGNCAISLDLLFAFSHALEVPAKDLLDFR